MNSNRFAPIFERCYNGMLPLTPILFEPEELAGLKYYEIDEDGNFNEELTNVFDDATLNPIGRADSRYLDFLEIKYARNFNLLTSKFFLMDQKEIYRPLPIIWSSFKSLDIKEPADEGGTLIYQEHGNFEKLNVDDFKDQVQYSQSLKSNIRFALMMKNFKMQGGMTGLFKEPHIYPFNKHVGNLDTPSYLTFNWIQNQKISLADWSESLINESENTIFGFIEDLKLSANGFKKGARLSHERFWTYDLGENGYYIENLKLYSEMLSMIIDVTLDISRKVWTEYRTTQLDLVNLIEKIIDL
jgi:hypothetical protein